MDNRQHRASFNPNVNTARINDKKEGESMFAANNIYDKTADNLARAEADTDEQPLRTDKNDEFEFEEDDEEFEIEVEPDDGEDEEFEEDETAY